MKFAFDVTDLTGPKRRRKGPNGVERVTLGLLKAAAARGDGSLFTPVFLGLDGLPRVLEPRDAVLLLAGSSTRLGRAPAADEFPLLVSTGASWTRGRLQTLHSGFPGSRRPDLVAMVHDVIPFTHPQFVSQGFAAEYRRWMDFVTGKARGVIVPSALSRAELLGHIPQTADKVHVMPLGADLAVKPAVNARRGLKPIIYVSSILPRKNHEMVVRAWRSAFSGLPLRHVPPLVLAGSRRWQTALRLKLLAGPLHWKLKVPGSIADAELAQLVDHALFFVFPSHAEGWGLPVSEAMARGKTGLISTAIPEEVDMGLLTRIPPADEAAWARELRSLAADASLRNSQEEAIRRDFRQGSWQAALDILLAACR